MALNNKRLDTPLATSPEARFVSDTIKPKTWQKMTIAEKGAKKTDLIKQGGMNLFLKYKDSISTDATNRREADINKAATSRGMTKSEYERWYKKNEKKPDAPVDGLMIKEACKRGETKGSCSTGQSNRGESLRDNK